MLERGIAVGLATDGANSSDALSMLQALRLASYASRVFDTPREAWLGAAETLRLATAGSADLLGIPRTGRIEIGAAADLVLFDLSHIDFMPLTDPLNQIVTAADSSSITDVLVDGRPILAAGRLTTIDPASIRDRIEDTVGRLATSLAEARALAARLEPHVVAFAQRAAAEPLGFTRQIPAGGAAS